MLSPPNPPQRDIYTVSRLNREVAQLLNSGFPLLWIEAEISNFSQPRSGHMYFSLKDHNAQVRAAMFRSKNLYLGFAPKDGMQVLLRARIALYEPRGDFQLIVEHMEQAGDGALRRAFEQLKQKLDAEGLFDAANKKPLPVCPQTIGVITSPTGAALRDVLHVLGRRYPLAAVIVYPVPVQGNTAAKEIVAMLNLAVRRRECDVLLLVRGGGSLEDLQAFNDESLARAIAACDIPLISGTGHETDFSIADFVADVRAPTPSAAAELAVPNCNELQQRTVALSNKLLNFIQRSIRQQQLMFNHLSQRLQRAHPQQWLNQQHQRLDELELRLKRTAHYTLQDKAAYLRQLNTSLFIFHPQHRIRHVSSLHQHLTQRLQAAINIRLKNKQQTLGNLLHNLEAVSPLATLARGYAIVTPVDSTAPLYEAAKTKQGDKLDVRLAKGELQVTVDAIKSTKT